MMLKCPTKAKHQLLLTSLVMKFLALLTVWLPTALSIAFAKSLIAYCSVDEWMNCRRVCPLDF